jgi:hypothetical protein
VKRQINKSIDLRYGDRATPLRREKPYVFIISSSLMQTLKIRKDLKANGYRPLGTMFEDSVFSVGVNLQDILKCDVVVFFNTDEMTLWQGSMLGASLACGKKIFCVSDPTRLGVNGASEPVLRMPQIEHFVSWNELMVLKFPLRKQYLRRRIARVQGWIGKYFGKRKTKKNVKRVEELNEQLGLLKREWDEKFGVLSLNDSNEMTADRLEE